jgi:hypothetical protein
VPPLPPKFRAYLQSLGFDLADPALTAAFLDGVRAAEHAIASEARWLRARCSTASCRG